MNIKNNNKDDNPTTYNDSKYLCTPNGSNQIHKTVNNRKKLIIIGDFITLLTSMDRLSKQRTNMKTVALNDTLEQMDVIDIFRTFHPNVAEYTFFSSAHATLSRRDHILAHKTSLNKFRKIDGQQMYEKMLNITHHQGNANQNHHEIPPYTCQNG